MGSASVSSIDHSWEGRTIDGKFALLECLGGTAGRGVFVTLRLGAQRAAIKLIRADDVEADAWLSQWELARRLSHPHLMPIFEIGRCTVDDLPVVYLVTECAERILSQFIQDRPLKLHETANILSPIADGLTYLHAKGFVHGRVKPSNILVSADQLKLSSDSFLVAASVPTQLAQPSPHDAPEIALGNFSPAADVWSLGMTIAEALTQQQPTWDPSSGRAPEIPPSLPLPFAEIVPECLRLDPVARCTLAEIKSRLVQRPAPPPLPTPEELVARVTQQPAQFRPAPPPHISPAAAEPMAPRPASKWRSEEPHPIAPSSSLFAGIEEANLTRRSKAPLVLGFLLVLAIGGFILVQTGFVDLPPSLARVLTPTRPSASQPMTAQPPSSAADTPATASAATTPTAPPSVQSTPQSPQRAPSTAALPGNSSDSGATSNPSAIQPVAPATTATPPSSSSDESADGSDSAPQPGSATAASASPAPAATQAGSEPKEPPRPRNAPGEVANRVMPSMSPEARDSMRAPVLVILRVTVNRNGSVADASYISPGAGNYFARIAERAAFQWTFDPPLHAGHPQASVWRLRFYFSRSNVEVSETEEDR